MLNRPRDYIPESQWQQGINAGLLNYSVTGQRNAPRHNGATIDSQFVSLQPGLNLGHGACATTAPIATAITTAAGSRFTSYLARDIHTPTQPAGGR